MLMSFSFYTNKGIVLAASGHKTSALSHPKLSPSTQKLKSHVNIQFIVHCNYLVYSLINAFTMTAIHIIKKMNLVFYKTGEIHRNSLLCSPLSWVQVVNIQYQHST